jgi:hypothetical protein
MLWRETATGEMCRVQVTDYDPALNLFAVLVMYFGGEVNEADWMDVEEFFSTHEPERMHS